MLLGQLWVFEFVPEYGFTNSFPEVLDYWSHYCLGLLIYTMLAHNQKLFRWDVILSRARTIIIAVKISVLWAFLVLGVALTIAMWPPVSRYFMIGSAVGMVVLLPVWRFCMHWVLHRTRLFGSCGKSMAIVGTGADAQVLAERLRSGKCGLYRFSGYISTLNHQSVDGAAVGDTLLGSVEDLENLMAVGGFDSIAVADVDLPRRDLVGIAKLCEMNFIDFKALPKSFEVFSSCLEVVNLGGVPLMSLMELPQNRSINRAIKRGVDILGSVVGLMICAPVFLVLIPMMRRESPGPVFYKQIRVGQGGKEFKIIKLRSMKVDAEASGSPGWSTRDDPRRTKIGSFMRKWNLDELPQFWNVLIGDMSLVGPRPERPELINGFLKEIPYYQSRHSVKPGMTGWAQVNGLRGDTSIPDRIRHDLQYIEKWSIWMDLSIQIKTFFNYKGAC